MSFKQTSVLKAANGSQKGGLIIKKEKDIKREPRESRSLLGLDRLAEEKKKENESIKTEKGSGSVKRKRDEDGDVAISFSSRDHSNAKKHIRRAIESTPSRGTGVDEEAFERIHERKQRHGLPVQSDRRDHYDSRSRYDGRSRSRDDRSGGRSSWNEITPSRSSSWDAPSPRRSSSGSTPRRDDDRDRRSTRRDEGRRDRGTPRGREVEATPLRGTPTWKQHSWVGDNSRSQRGGREKGEWDETPRRKAGEETPRRGEKGKARESPSSAEQHDYEEEKERDFEREFYNDEGAVDLADGGEKAFLGNKEKWQEREKEVEKKQIERLSARRLALNADNRKWEDNRLLTSGVAAMKKVDLDFDEESEARVFLLVHDIKPPFLDGRVVFTKQQEAVSVVKDPTSDVAVLAKKGSQVLKELREQKDKMKHRNRYWDLQNSKIGKATGLGAAEAEKEKAEKKTKEADEEGSGPVFTGDDKESVDYRKSAGFAEHMETMSSEAVSHFALSKTLKEQREFLPIFKVRNYLMNVIRDNQIIVIVGQTGSGKTTQLTQYMHEEGYSKVGMIGCTQPRRVAAMSVAKRVSEEMKCALGGKVGYAIRFEDVTGRDTVIKYMTDGVLLRESLTDPELDQYSCIIMDEAHERSLHTDILFGILKHVAMRRSDIKIIITSATLDSERFGEFFGGVPIFTVPGRTFPVEKFHSKTPSEDYVDEAVKQVLAIHLGEPPGDILVFMTGQEDIEATCHLTAERLERLGAEVPPLNILPIYSQLPSDLQAKIFQKSSDGSRKVIVATNIAEVGFL